MPHSLQPKEVSKNCFALVKKFEGLHTVMDDGRIRSYRDPAGVWTIGYGHTKGVRSGQHITEAEAEAFLVEDIQVAIASVRRKVNVPLSQHQFDALVSWTYNLGEGNLASSTLLRKLNAGEYSAVPSEMTKWHKATVNGVKVSLPGLVRRRAAESALFTLDADAGDIAPSTGKVVAPPRQKPLSQSRTLLGLSLTGFSLIVGQVTELLTPLKSTSDIIEPIWVALSIAGIVLSAYARIDDHIKDARG